MKSIKPKGIGGIGLKSPWSKDPSDNDTRAFTGTGCGDYYGSGVKNPVGRIRKGTGVNFVPENQLNVPPKKLA